MRQSVAHPARQTYDGIMNAIVFYSALAVSVVGFAVALRFLFMAWSDYRIRRERRQNADRRRRQSPVPMERRKGDRRG